MESAYATVVSFGFLENVQEKAYSILDGTAGAVRPFL